MTNVITAYNNLLKFRSMILLALIVLIIFFTLIDFTLGPSSLTFNELINALLSPDEVKLSTKIIVWQIRLPIAIMSILVGFALGLSGAEMQTVLNNPLASPFTLGVSSAASFGAALAIVLGIGIVGNESGWFVTMNAFVFALFATFVLDLLTRTTNASVSSVVLFGIVLVFAFNSLVSMLQFIATEDTLQGLVMWTMGNISRATWEKIIILTIAITVIFPWSWLSSWQLTALRLGEDRATSFGVDIKKLRLHTLLRISILASICVAFVGPIGFIGLVAPHSARLIVGEDHKFYLPASALIGALIMSISSILSKNILNGIIIPIGIITSIIGVPFFLSIIIKYRRQL